jgi:hypothetical protein
MTLQVVSGAALLAAVSGYLAGRVSVPTPAPLLAVSPPCNCNCHCQADKSPFQDALLILVALLFVLVAALCSVIAVLSQKQVAPRALSKGKPGKGVLGSSAGQLQISG